MIAWMVKALRPARIRMRRALAAGAVVGVSLGLHTAAHAASYALLVGVGECAEPTFKPLEGPPHDVSALKEVLQSEWGVDPQHITTLVDREATRAAILSHLDALTRTTQPGDFIFFYVSSHGTSGYDPGAKCHGLSMDPLTGALVPSDFRKSEQADEMLARLIIGKRDLRPILERLDAGRQVFAVFDACFSGNSVRSLGNRHRGVPRFVNVWRNLKSADPGQELTGDEGPGRYETPAEGNAPFPYRNVVYISAASKLELAEDIDSSRLSLGGVYKTVDGRPHGALTDALLRGLRGEANTNGDDRVTYREFFNYVKGNVTSRFSQTPGILYSETNERLLDQPIFNQKASPAVPGAVPDIVVPERALRVALENLDAGMEREIAGIKGVQVVKKGQDLLVVREEAKYRLYLSNGDRLVEFPETTPARVLDRIRGQVGVKALTGLTFPGQSFNVSVDLMSSRGYLVEGDSVGFKIRADADCYILLLDIDALGTVRVIYPDSVSELAPVKGNTDKVLKNIGVVVSPFGTEYVKLLAFQEQPPFLSEALFAAEFSPSDPRLSQLLKAIQESRGGKAQGKLQTATFSKKEATGRP